MRRTLALGLAAAAVVVLPASPAYAEDVECSSIGLNSDSTPRTTATSTPLELLGVRRFHELLEQRGRRGPVGVAVLDSELGGSGYARGQGQRAVTPQEPGWHGTAVAGLIAGKPRDGDLAVGVAPDVVVHGVTVWDEADQERDRPSSADVAAGLEWVAANARRLGIRVANVSLEVEHTSRLRNAVRKATGAGVLVVAAAGDRGGAAALDDRFSEFVPGAGEDAADEVFPAGYDEVLAVTAVMAGRPGGGDAREFVVQSSATDLAAPTYGAVSTGVKGTCVLRDGVSSHWAAAEVSGIAALLWSAHPDETLAQLRARLLTSASGRPDAKTVTTGAGIVQPVEALTRPLSPSKDGSLPWSTTEVPPDPPAAAPQPARDQLASLRGTAMWWGLVGGIGIVVVLLLRPLLRRR